MAATPQKPKSRRLTKSVTPEGYIVTDENGGLVKAEIRITLKGTKP